MMSDASQSRPMRNNVRPFIPRRPPEPAHPGWRARLLIAAVYLVLGYSFRLPSAELLNAFIILGLLYWGFVHQRRQNFSYFVRYHLLMALTGFLVLILAAQVLMSVLAVIASGLAVVGLVRLLDPLFGLGLTGYVHIGFVLIIMGYGVVMAIASLLGRTPRVPWLSDQTRFWA